MGDSVIAYLKLFHKEDHIDSDVVLPTVALGSLLPEIDPAHRSEVGGLSTVEALIEDSMVTLGGGDNEMATPETPGGGTTNSWTC